MWDSYINILTLEATILNFKDLDIKMSFSKKSFIKLHLESTKQWLIVGHLWVFGNRQEGCLLRVKRKVGSKL